MTQQNKYGKVIANEAKEVTWNRVNVDLWRPATIDKKKGTKLEMYLMTMIDPVSCWFEVAPIHGNPNSHKRNPIHVDVWLSRYQRPQVVGSDRGSEFKFCFE